jgi:hypothetical protein
MCSLHFNVHLGTLADKSSKLMTQACAYRGHADSPFVLNGHLVHICDKIQMLFFHQSRERQKRVLYEFHH